MTDRSINARELCFACMADTSGNLVLSWQQSQLRTHGRGANKMVHLTGPPAGGIRCRGVVREHILKLFSIEAGDLDPHIDCERPSCPIWH